MSRMPFRRASERLIRAALIGACVGGLVTIGPARAYAHPHRMDRDVRTVLVTGGYGLVGGTVLGVISYPATQSARGVFVGSSVGLYLGVAIGIWHVLNRDDPNNPLALGRDQGPDETSVAASRKGLDARGPAPLFEARILQLRF